MVDFSEPNSPDFNSIFGERSGLTFLGGLVKTHLVIANLEKMRLIPPLTDSSRVVVLQSGAGFEPWYFARRGVKQVVAVDDQRSSNKQFQAQDYFLKDRKIKFERKSIADWLKGQPAGSADLIYISNVESGSVFPTLPGSSSPSVPISADLSRVLGSNGTLVYEEEALGVPSSSHIQPYLSWERIDPSKLDVSLPLPGYISQIKSGQISGEEVRGVNLQGTILMRSRSA